MVYRERPKEQASRVSAVHVNEEWSLLGTVYTL